MYELFNPPSPYKASSVIRPIVQSAVTEARRGYITWPWSHNWKWQDLSPGAGAQSPAPAWSRILPLCKVRAPRTASQVGKIYEEISHPLKIKQLTKWLQQLFACWREHSYSVSAALWNVRLRGLVISAWAATGESRIRRQGIYISRSACLVSLSVQKKLASNHLAPGARWGPGGVLGLLPILQPLYKTAPDPGLPRDFTLLNPTH